MDVLTTLPPNLSDAPFFNSLHLLMTLPTGEFVYKINTLEKIPTETLNALFGHGSVKWIYCKVWQAYPRLDPIVEFGPIDLYPQDTSGAGVWYTSGIESFVSAMEVSAVNGRNVAANIARRLWGDIDISDI
jgi:prenylcysteine oxidase/farnesylcysteine lyase